MNWSGWAMPVVWSSSPDFWCSLCAGGNPECNKEHNMNGGKACDSSTVHSLHVRILAVPCVSSILYIPCLQPLTPVFLHSVSMLLCTVYCSGTLSFCWGIAHFGLWLGVKWTTVPHSLFLTNTLSCARPSHLPQEIPCHPTVAGIDHIVCVAQWGKFSSFCLERENPSLLYGSVPPTAEHGCGKDAEVVSLDGQAETDKSFRWDWFDELRTVVPSNCTE